MAYRLLSRASQTLSRVAIGCCAMLGSFAVGCGDDASSAEDNSDASTEPSPEPASPSSPTSDDDGPEASDDDDTPNGDDDDAPIGDDDDDTTTDDDPTPSTPLDDGGTPSTQNPDASDAAVPDEPELTTDSGTVPPEPDASSNDAGTDAGNPSPDAGDTDPDTENDAGPLAGKLVFATSTTYTGALGGFDGADQICAVHAEDAGLTGEFKAWLSTLGTSAASRLAHSSKPYMLTNGVVIAEDFDDLLDGSLLAPINRDEFGNFATGDTWTGTLATGEPYPGDDCLGFTDGTFAASAQCGNTAAANGAWTENIVPACISSLRLYCFEQ